jgi:hypothetical protein
MRASHDRIRAGRDGRDRATAASVPVSRGPLASANTLVITAADSDHSSFGCQDKVKWTYFGDAFFNRALRHTTDLRSAFATARKLISLRERHDGLVPSNPQISGGKNIDVMLAEKRGAATTGQQPRHPELE